jgi:hypothetical protein
LGRGIYLPVEVPATSRYKKGVRVGLTEKYHHFSFLVLERDDGTVEPEVLCCAHKLREMWNGKREVIEELNSQPIEARGRDSTKDRF